MTDHQHTPDSLAEELDRVLATKHPEKTGDPLVDTAVRLANTPLPRLSKPAVDRIQRRVLLAHQRRVQPARSRPPHWIQWAALAAAGSLILVIVVLAGHINNIQNSGATLLPLVTTTTLGSSSPFLPPTELPTTTMSMDATEETTALSPAVMTPSLSAPITIDGPVETIDANTVTIGHIVVQLDRTDPLLTVLQIGDVLHVEGTPQEGKKGVVIVATLVRIVNADVFTNSDGQVWRDNGRCTNPPPDWAPAVGWYQRCQSGHPGNNPGKGNFGSGNRGH